MPNKYIKQKSKIHSAKEEKKFLKITFPHNMHFHLSILSCQLQHYLIKYANDYAKSKMERKEFEMY